MVFDRRYKAFGRLLTLFYSNFHEHKALSHEDHINLLTIDNYLDKMKTTEMTMEQSRSWKNNVE